jgi:hypothetical protein
MQHPRARMSNNQAQVSTDGVSCEIEQASGGSGVVAVRMLRPRSGASIKSHHVGTVSVSTADKEPHEVYPAYHTLERMWARQVQVRYNLVDTMLSKQLVCTLPEFQWMTSHTAAALGHDGASAVESFFRTMLATVPAIGKLPIIPAPVIDPGQNAPGDFCRLQ